MSTETETLVPDCELVYSAFRAALIVTLDSLLRQSLTGQRASLSSTGGFLDRIPLLSSMAPQVQLECLCRTWQNVSAASPVPMSTLNECVVQAALETLIDLSERQQDRQLQMIWRGPRRIRLGADAWLVSRIRTLQVLFPSQNLSKFANLNDWTHLAPADSSAELSIEERQERQSLLGLLGQWAICGDAVTLAQDLLNSSESSLIQAFFEEHPGLLS